MTASANSAIAVTGFACRVPGAADEQQFWSNVERGTASFKRFGREELARAGVPERMLERPNFVPVCGYLEGADCFDAEFFGLKWAEAQISDPQQRLLLECAWEALESAGCDPLAWPGRIGCFAGAGMSLYAGRRCASYLTANLLTNPALLDDLVAPQISVANRNDYLATRLGYAMSFRGPCVNVQTACSTGLAAVHLARASLLLGDCDMALAGAAAVHVPLKTGYLYEGGLLSPDGSCRPFDADACGTVGGSGVGMVVLRRLDQALKDGDPIRAVILGSSMNNDGNRKVSFLAPGVEGQIGVIRAALDDAGVAPSTIGYVEAHGTGTPLGDPIEVCSLTEAYRERTAQSGYCALGSAKANVGHLDTAAGIIGLIKAVLTLEHGRIPKLAGFRRPNPNLALEGSPFFIPRETQPWPTSSAPRRAAVSSFGAGGTNVHLILEQAPVRAPAKASAARPEVLVFSARSPERLAELRSRYQSHLRSSGEAWSDLAYTSGAGRHHFECRAAIVADDRNEALKLLEEQQTPAPCDSPRPSSVAFLFPGQGALALDVAQELYLQDIHFHRKFDECSELYAELKGRSLVELLRNPVAHALDDPEVVQLLVLASSLSLAAVWCERGVTPSVVLGHSLGEYAAAHVAGVMDLETVIRLVEARGRLMREHCPPGAMVSVQAPVSEVHRLLEFGGHRDLVVAAFNAPESVVVAGAPQACTDFEQLAQESGTATVRLDTTHAFHSPSIEGMLEPFDAVLRTVSLRSPTIPLLSSMTGGFADVTQPSYWTRQLRSPVQFQRALEAVPDQTVSHLLELGTGTALSNLALATLGSRVTPLPSVRRGRVLHQLAKTCASLYIAGVDVHWKAVYAGRTGHHARLPSYPFKRRRCWVDPPSDAQKRGAPHQPTIWELRWQKHELAPARPAAADDWLIVGASVEVTRALGHALEQRGVNCRVRAGSRSDIRPWLEERGARRRSLLLFFADDLRSTNGGSVNRLRGVSDLLALTKDLAAARLSGCTVVLATAGAQSVPSVADLCTKPEQAALWGFVRAARREIPEARWCSVDLFGVSPELTSALADELASGLQDTEVAWRKSGRFIPVLTAVATDAEPPALGLDKHGAYLVTGGFGGLGIRLARHLVDRGASHLLLVGRRPPPLEVSQGIQNLRNAGVQIETLCLDIGDAESAKRLQQVLSDTGRPLKGVFHLAGIIRDASLVRLGRSALLDVLHPKLEGALHLDRLSRAHRLDYFVAFSSAAALIGSPGQANYAAANAGMDCIVERRRSEGLPGLSVRFGPFAEAGLAARQTVHEAPGFGFTPLNVSDGLRALEQVLTSGSQRPLIAGAGDRLTSKLATSTLAVTDFASRVWGDAGLPDHSVAARDASALDNPGERPQSVLDLIVCESAKLVDQPPTNFDPARGFVDQGLDSMRGLQLRSRLTAALGVSLPAAAIFLHPTPAQLAAAIVADIEDSAAASSRPANGAGGRLEGVVQEITALRRNSELTTDSPNEPGTIARAFERDGFVGPLKVYEPEQARELLRQIRIDNLDRGRAIFDNDVNYDRHFDIPALTRHIGHPRIIELLNQILGRDLLCWRSEFFPKFPGSVGTEWHQVVDYSYATGKPMLKSALGQGVAQLDVTVWTAFTDATRENGCMKFLPGSHRHRYYDEHKEVARGRNTEYRSAEAGTAFFGYEFQDFKIDPGWVPDESQAVAMEMRAGECVIFTASCVHASFPNTTQRQTRFAIAARYVPTHVRVYPDWQGFHAHGGKFDLDEYGCVLVSGTDHYGHNRLRDTNQLGERFPYSTT